MLRVLPAFVGENAQFRRRGACSYTRPRGWGVMLFSILGEIYNVERKAPRPLEKHPSSRDNSLSGEREGELLRNFHGRSFSFREACEGLRLGTTILDIVIQ